MNYLFIRLNLSTVWDVFLCYAQKMLYTWRCLELVKIKWSWIWLAMLHTSSSWWPSHQWSSLKAVELWRSLCLCPAGLPGPHHRDHPRALLHGPSVGEEASGHAGGQRRQRKICSGGRQTGFFRPGEIRHQKRTLQLLHHVSHVTGCVCVFRNIRPWTQKCNFKPFWQWQILVI